MVRIGAIHVKPTVDLHGERHLAGVDVDTPGLTLHTSAHTEQLINNNMVLRHIWKFPWDVGAETSGDVDTGDQIPARLQVNDQVTDIGTM
ncbi:hypothetical protein D3C71_1672020 [compost metagenome]